MCTPEATLDGNEWSDVSPHARHLAFGLSARVVQQNGQQRTFHSRANANVCLTASTDL